MVCDLVVLIERKLCIKDMYFSENFVYLVITWIFYFFHTVFSQSLEPRDGRYGMEEGLTLILLRCVQKQFSRASIIFQQDTLTVLEWGVSFFYPLCGLQGE